ncbi:transposon Tf2-1 polyprotein isoform X1 [Cucumis melo var. makuwa]|uniref:Transposon Tf2-1 polyprotein isoform X1 n=1 Tax=Cucumis melo var. makuwa TaxID=1194695 RepID=A0A5A7V861_CUCMM|nr:transposon Tf2-1 polyprotein isoform X1 [Cucumis melo var. makuwa]
MAQKHLEEKMEANDAEIATIREFRGNEVVTLKCPNGDRALKIYSNRNHRRGRTEWKKERERTNGESNDNCEWNVTTNGSRNRKKQVQESRNVEIFNIIDLNSWLFKVDRYFQIHKLTEAEKLIVAVIRFESVALDWYRANEEREPFDDWKTLNTKLL